jgi:hypothetical protein
MKFSEQKHIRTVLYCEGISIEVFSYQGAHYIQTWVDIDWGSPVVNYFVAAQITGDQYAAYLQRKLSLAEIQRATPVLYYGAHTANLDAEMQIVTYDQIPEDRRAPDTAFYDPSLDPLN